MFQKSLDTTVQKVDEIRENFSKELKTIIKKKKNSRAFSSSPVVKTLHFHFRGHRFKFLVGELRSHMPRGMAKKKKTNPESNCKFRLGNGTNETTLS